MIFGLLIFNGFFDDVVSQYLWMKGVQWTSPTAATVGLSLTIPMSVVTDILRWKPLTAWSYVAACFVISGFVAVSCASKPSEGPDTMGGTSNLLAESRTGNATAELEMEWAEMAAG